MHLYLSKLALDSKDVLSRLGIYIKQCMTNKQALQDDLNGGKSLDIDMLSSRDNSMKTITCAHPSPSMPVEVTRAPLGELVHNHIAFISQTLNRSQKNMQTRK